MSLPAQHQNERINTWLDNYANAFNQADVSVLIANYATPCVMSTPDKTLLVENTEQLASELHAIIAMMKEHKFQQASYQINTQLITENGNILVSVLWQMIDEKSQVFAEFNALYQLCETSSQIKIISVISYYPN